MKTATLKTVALQCLALALSLITVHAQPTITSPPTNQVVPVGATATFSVTVSDTLPVTYLWQFNGTNVPNQIITIAGINTNAYSGDNGPATNAALNGPDGVCVDSVGNVYIADTQNQRIRKVATNGIITTIAGNGTANFYGQNVPATSAYLNTPTGLAVDTNGQIYIGDSGNFRVRRIDTNGIISTYAGNGTAGDTGDNGAATSAELESMFGIALDPQGNLYITDVLDGRIRRVATNGIITTLVSGLSNPYGVTAPISNYLFIAESEITATLTNCRVQVYNNGILGTSAGTGALGFSGDGGDPTKARLSPPFDVVYAPAIPGYYIADAGNARIRQVAFGPLGQFGETNIISTIAGNGTHSTSGDGSLATDASINRPFGLALDSAGNLFIADQMGGRIREVSPFANKPTLTLGGVQVTEAGSYSVIVSDSSGSVTSAVVTLTVYTPPTITAQPTNQNILNGSNATLSVTATGTPPFSYTWLFDGTNTLQSGPSNTLALTDLSTNDSGFYSVIVSNPYAAVTSAVATISVGLPPSITTQPASEFAWTGSNALFTVTPGGTGPFEYQWQLNGTNIPNDIFVTVAGGGTNTANPITGPATNAELGLLYGVAADNAGNFYIVEPVLTRLTKVDSNGIISTIAGGLGNISAGDGGPATNASLRQSESVAVDELGNIYVGEQYRVRKIDANGIITTIAGTNQAGIIGDNEPATNVELNVVAGIACDSDGNIFFSESMNHRVRKVDSYGIITTIAGNLTQGYNGDNIAATNAELNIPGGIAVDGSGNVFIADTGNNRVRKVGTNGVIQTFAGGGSGTSGSGVATNASFRSPAGLAFDPSGNLYVADATDYQVRKIYTNGSFVTVAGNFPGSTLATNILLEDPVAVSTDNAGNLYIVDSETRLIHKALYAGQPSLFLKNINLTNAGDYSVIITTPYGSITSSVVSLTLIAQPNITAITLNPDGTVALNYTGTPNAPHTLWSTTDLTDWTIIATNLTTTNGIGNLLDTNAPATTSRFYRISFP
jgi:sugar lactone lactonase YvrE